MAILTMAILTTHQAAVARHVVGEGLAIREGERRDALDIYTYMCMFRVRDLVNTTTTTTICMPCMCIWM